MIDLNARYAVAGYPGIAFYLLGHPLNEPEECEGHESLAGEHMGEAVYCDGSCQPEPAEDTGMVRAVMVGDDTVHLIDVDDLTVISEDDYCSGCGQIGCGHG